MTRRICAILFATLVAVFASGCGDQTTSPADDDPLVEQPPDTTGTGETQQRDWYAQSVVYVPDSVFAGDTVITRTLGPLTPADTDTENVIVDFATSHGRWYVHPHVVTHWFTAGVELLAVTTDSSDSVITALRDIVNERGDRVQRYGDYWSIEIPISYAKADSDYVAVIDYYAAHDAIIRSVLPSSPPHAD